MSYYVYLYHHYAKTHTEKLPLETRRIISKQTMAMRCNEHPQSQPRMEDRDKKTNAISSESSLTYPKKIAHMWSGWWLCHPSEKYESQLGLVFPRYGNITVMYQTTATSAFEINPTKTRKLHAHIDCGCPGFVKVLDCLAPAAFARCGGSCFSPPAGAWERGAKKRLEPTRGAENAK